MPLEDYEAQIIVFTPGRAQPVITATTLAQVTGIEVGADGRVVLSGTVDRPGAHEATVQLSGRTVTLRGETAPLEPAMAIDGAWEFELKPTMDNRWGDFRLPATQRMIGAEARRFRFTEQTAGEGYEAKAVDDSRWPVVTHGFGQKFWKLGPLPTDVDVTQLEAMLASLERIDPAKPIEVGGRKLAWTPYAFSWRWGVEGDPGHQGYHGLKENVSDDFIRLGAPKGGLNETRYVAESAGTRYYLWTTALANRDVDASVIAGGEMKPAAIYLNGAQVAASSSTLPLKAGANRLLLRYDAPGRGHFVLEAAQASDPTSRTPLSMRWYDRPGVVRYDVHGTTPPASWYRFTAPPGLRGMTLTAFGRLHAWADGEPLTVRGETGAGGAVRYEIKLPERDDRSSVALRLEPRAGYSGGEVIPEPILLDCGVGMTALGDWSQGSALECYSGGAWYRKTVSVSPGQAARRLVLNLGNVAATAEVHVNGQRAGVRVAPPWTFDVTELMKPGDNRLEVLVYNTLANHYLTIPTRYRGSPKSGLLGPVSLEFPGIVTLRE